MTERTDPERIEEGQILIRTIIEILGAPKEYVEKSLKEYVEKLKNDDSLEIRKAYFAETVAKDKLFSTYTELELWLKSPERLVEFCFDTMPSSIEILEPEELRMPANRFSGLLNDLQAKLHLLDSSLKRYITDQKVGAKNFKAVLDNFAVYAIKNGVDKSKELSQLIGVEEDRLIKWMEELVTKKVIVKKDNSYRLLDE